MEIKRLTQTGKATHTAISPDGKYAVYVMEDVGRQSLWLSHVATKSYQPIIPPAEVNYRGVTFTPDGNFIYIVRGKPHEADLNRGFLDTSGALYRTTILGKDEKKLIEKVYDSISLSPDGNRLAFLRLNVDQATTALIVTNTDGTSEKELATRKGRDNVTPELGFAWSPDGKIIAVSEGNIVGVRVADGAEIPITSHQWGIASRQIQWLPDGSGFLVIGGERERDRDPKQIWHLSNPDGIVQKVTNDLSDYVDLSLTADSMTMAAVQVDRLINIWIVPDGDVSRAKQLTSGVGRMDGQEGLAWTPDGKIVFCSKAGGDLPVWIMEADGTGNKQLTFNNTANIQPAVSPDGRYIVRSTGSPRNIWRMDIDGGNLKQLTNGVGEWCPQYSPDGKWLIYVSAEKLWKLPLDGGTPVQLSEARSFLPSISPDGKLIAFNLWDEASGQWKIAIMPFEGGPPIKVFNILGGTFRRPIWTPDGRAVAYPIYRGGATNIWAQPLDGGPPKQLTDFRDGLIFNFAWSRDGKQLALSRGIINSDVVLISNFR
jgi:Tol biopolymer transport system component